jgi:DNA invertase Pin-like site-specific DNA recombinase
MQLVELRRFAQARQWQILGEFVDTISGVTTSRPEFDKMMELLRRRKADVLLCWKFDRIGRSTEHLLQILNELRSLNVGFCSVTEGVDTTTSVGKLVFTFLAGVAEFERNLVRERVRAGMRAAKERGRRIGRPPLSREIVEKILALRASGLTLGQIALRTGRRRSSAAGVCRRAAQKGLQKAAPEPAEIKGPGDRVSAT